MLPVRCFEYGFAKWSRCVPACRWREFGWREYQTPPNLESEFPDPACRQISTSRSPECDLALLLRVLSKWRDQRFRNVRMLLSKSRLCLRQAGSPSGGG